MKRERGMGRLTERESQRGVEKGRQRGVREGAGLLSRAPGRHMMASQVAKQPRGRLPIC